jgi:hypothetical protein
MWRRTYARISSSVRDRLPFGRDAQRLRRNVAGQDADDRLEHVAQDVFGKGGRPVPVLGQQHGPQVVEPFLFGGVLHEAAARLVGGVEEVFYGLLPVFVALPGLVAAEERLGEPDVAELGGRADLEEVVVLGPEQEHVAGPVVEPVFVDHVHALAPVDEDDLEVVVVVQRVRPLAQRKQRNVKRLVLVEAFHRAVSGALVSSTSAFDFLVQNSSLSSLY